MNKTIVEYLSILNLLALIWIWVLGYVQIAFGWFVVVLIISFLVFLVLASPAAKAARTNVKTNSDKTTEVESMTVSFEDKDSQPK